MNIGKIPPSLLEELVFSPNQKNPRRAEVLTGSAMGEDCATVDFGENICCVSTDPITGKVDAESMGYLAVHVNANDAYAAGAEPVGLTVTVLLPDGADANELRKIMNGVYRAANEVGAEVIGGHSEVTDAVTRPVVSVTVLGKAKKMISTSGARAGQDLIMTKYAGLEGTAILSGEFSEYLSVRTEAEVAVSFGATAMHDITEGGVLGAAYEMAEASKAGVTVFLDRVPILDETREICERLSLDPYRLISSGSLLIAADDGGKLVEILKERGVNAAVVGKFGGEGKWVEMGEKKEPLTEPGSDEIYKV